MTDTIDLDDAPVAEPDARTIVVLPGHDLAYAWNTITRACAVDDNGRMLTGLSIDVHGADTVRLTANDGCHLYTCVVGDSIDVDDLDTTPDSTWLIDPMTPVSSPLLESATRRSGSSMTVTVTLDEAGAEMRVGHGERASHLHLPAVAGDYPDWRTVMRGAKAKCKTGSGSTGRVHLGLRTLPLLAELATDDHPVELRIAGPLDPVLVGIGAGRLAVRGLIMPVRAR